MGMSEEHQAAVLEEIRLIIAEALREGDIIRLTFSQRSLRAVWPVGERLRSLRC